MIEETRSQDRPVTATDRVSDVLARDESLVEVFARHAPHFAKLRNRAMRKVMAHLVTVEQAARTANVPADGLVNELNAALGLAVSGELAPSTPARAGVGTSLIHPAWATVVDLDVRDDLRSGREPFSRIMSTVSSLGAHDVLHLRVTFEPAPLFTVLGKRGFAHQSRSHATDDWSVWFWRPAVADPVADPVDQDSSRPPAVDSDIPADDASTTYLDVRDLDPPEPMMRTLAALETLTVGHTLVQINARVPQFLFPVLAERGFAWETDESRSDRILVRIHHAA